MATDKTFRVRALQRIQLSKPTEPWRVAAKGQEFDVEPSAFSWLSMQPIGWDPAKTPGVRKPPPDRDARLTRDERIAAAAARATVQALADLGALSRE